MKICSINLLKATIGLCFLIVLVVLGQNQTAFAASPITINAVDYENEEIVINNNSNTRIYFATDTDAAKNNWEVLNADRNLDGTLANTTTIDFSWVSSTSENVVVVKGEENAQQARVILRERTKKLELSIRYTNMSKLTKTDTIATLLNIQSTSGTAEEPIDYDDLEWKKGEGGKWKNINTLTVAQLEKYQIKGIYLYFRIKAINDVTDGTEFANGTEGRRVSKEYRLKITKKSAPMVVGIDGDEFTADIKYGKEYRVTTASGTTGWTKVTNKAIKYLPLATVINDGSDGSTADKAFGEMFIEIRSYSTAKSAASKITEITLDPQRILLGDIIEGEVPEDATAADDDIYITYNGNKNMTITIPSASSSEPYEYCVVKPGDMLDFEKVSWSSVTKNTEVKIISSKAVEGGTLYVRQKEIKSRAETRTSPAVAFALASTYVTKVINYPSIPEIEIEKFTFTKGYSEDIIFTIRLNEAGKKPYETQIKNIKLGTREIEYTTSVAQEIPNPLEPSKTISVMTVTLKEVSLKELPNCYSRVLSIYFENGTIDKKSIRLTIQNPTPAYRLTASANKGTASGTTAVTITSSLGTSNSWVYTIGDTEIEDQYTQDTMTTGTAYTSGDNITITANKYLTIYEINTTTNNIVKYRSILITADKIL